MKLNKQKLKIFNNMYFLIGCKLSSKYSNHFNIKAKFGSDWFKTVLSINLSNITKILTLTLSEYVSCHFFCFFFFFFFYKKINK